MTLLPLPVPGAGPAPEVTALIREAASEWSPVCMCVSGRVCGWLVGLVGASGGLGGGHAIHAYTGT